ncbi:MAG: glycoside hydrolase family 43 protein [Cyclobacteriaceae bacterium]
MKYVTNPILRGFNPDPSILRVGDDYYIATSTFEWFPGVQIHHSTDMINWNLVARPLNRISQLDMLGVPDSCGVWAPCLSYDNGTFYLVYCDVKSFDGVWKDTPNYLVTTEDILGDWSDPIFLNSSGFDGSLFHDSDGTKWYTSMLVDHRNGKFFGGIIIQQYDPDQKKLIGPVKHIFEGSELGKTEGPHIYQRDGYYYLLTAEGGTEYGHAVSIARAKELFGPYELHPDNPFVSSKDNENAVLQKTGHGDLIQTQDGRWYSIFLVGRPLSTHGRCTLGRETAMAEVVWEDGDWPYLKSGSRVPELTVEVPDLIPTSVKRNNIRDNFDEKHLDINFQSLRVPITSDWFSLEEREGFLRLYGRESLSSFHNQSLIARRLQAFNVKASVCLDFQPDNFQQLAGLVCFYNTAHYHYLAVSMDSTTDKRNLNIYTCDNFETSEPLADPLPLSSDHPVFLSLVWNREVIQFYYALAENEWEPVGPTLDGSILSDDYVRDGSSRYRPAFTGAFIGLCCQDLTGSRKHADFDWFEYKEFDQD